MTKHLISSAFFAVLLSSCSYPMEELGVFKTGGPSLPILDMKFQNEELSFEVVKSTALQTCLECHTSGSRSMDTAEEVLAQRESILTVVHKESMPPRSGGYSPLSSCEKQILETWIDDQIQSRTQVQKVKELSACATAEAPKKKTKVDLKALEVSFDNLQKEILQPKCMVCHTTESAKRTILETLEHIKGHRLLAETAEASVLYQVTVPGMNKRFMPPQRGKTILPPLTADELDYLKRWIEQEASK